VAESALEFEMFTQGRGEMFDWLRRSGRDMSDCGLRSPVKHLERHAALNKNLLAVHVNYLGHGDAAALGRRKVSVAHCPRSHAYFGHAPFPRQKLERAGVNLCLGTDSLASVYRARRQSVGLNMFEEMRALAKSDSDVSPKHILRWATINGARALGLDEQVGELAPDAYADLIAIPFTGKIGRIYESIVAHSGDVAASMIGGQWVKRDA
jgi:cytosine/adenosine deaminase-related metal-dependent hydrolase